MKSTMTAISRVIISGGSLVCDLKKCAVMSKNHDRYGSFPRERRLWVRHNVYIPVKLQAKNSIGRDISETTCIINISTGGAFLISRNGYKPGTELDIVTDPLNGESPRCHVRAKVVRIQKNLKGFSDYKGHGLGVSFMQKDDLFKCILAAAHANNTPPRGR